MTPDRSDDGVLDPEDLVLDPEHVDRIEDNRFVVRPDDTDGGPSADGSSPRLGPAEEVRLSDVDGSSRDPRDGSSASPNPITDADGPTLGSGPEPAGTPESEPADAPASETAGASVTDPSSETGADPTDALAADPAPHGVDISLKTDGAVARHRSTSTDVREVFADMMAWYASQLGDDVTPMEALEVLVATTDLDERA
ncbi:DUF7500 family protein [Halovivax cerinus]|uniref:Uncharacterized protein n=1 Tax=Halovivax cerinus TaxID=1487865 RepID=A0ABD5NSW7_9EURY|nr:hypothetical protein [Halovivax cerinus]